MWYGTNFGENKEKSDKRETSGNSDGHRSSHFALNISINEALAIGADNLVQYGATRTQKACWEIIRIARKKYVSHMLTMPH